MSKVSEIVSQLEMTPHPEGGHYKETYRSTGSIKPDSLWKNAHEDRSYSTGIYFLLAGEEFSAFHKIKSDEMWHFYGGTALLLHMIDQEGNYSMVKIGNKINQGEHLQFVVPANVWFASEVEDKSSYALCGCTVSPGFDFRDFDMPSKNEMIEMFPDLSSIISRLSR